MQMRVIVIFFFCLFEAITFSTARCADPLTLALETILADVTFEIVPYPTYPDVYEPICQCGGCYSSQCGVNPPCYDPPNCGLQAPCYFDSCQYGIPAPPCYIDPPFCGLQAPCYFDPPSCQYGIPAPACQCGMPPCYFDPPSCGMPCSSCGQCDIYPGNCYRDVLNPCGTCGDRYNYVDNCGCDWLQCPPPYIYFPEVEYPVTAMDVRPYFCGSCWTS